MRFAMIIFSMFTALMIGVGQDDAVVLTQNSSTIASVLSNAEFAEMWEDNLQATNYSYSFNSVEHGDVLNFGYDYAPSPHPYENSLVSTEFAISSDGTLYIFMRGIGISVFSSSSEHIETIAFPNLEDSYTYTNMSLDELGGNMYFQAFTPSLEGDDTYLVKLSLHDHTLTKYKTTGTVLNGALVRAVSGTLYTHFNNSYYTLSIDGDVYSLETEFQSIDPWVSLPDELRGMYFPFRANAVSDAAYMFEIVLYDEQGEGAKYVYSNENRVLSQEKVNGVAPWSKLSVRSMYMSETPDEFFIWLKEDIMGKNATFQDTVTESYEHMLRIDSQGTISALCEVPSELHHIRDAQDAYIMTNDGATIHIAKIEYFLSDWQDNDIFVRVS